MTQVQSPPVARARSADRMWSKRRRKNALMEVALAGALLLTLVPILWMCLLAFLPNRAIVSSSWQFPFSTVNFETVLGDRLFLTQITNSIMIVLGAVTICLVIGTLAGYTLSKLKPPMWLVLPSLVVAAFIPLVPPMTLVPGLYLLLNEIGLLGTIPGLILVNAFFNLPFALLMMVSYFNGLPNELREAGMIDGASELRMFFSVALPLVRPGLAAVAIFVGIMSWNEFVMGLTLTTGGRDAPITVGIAGLLQPYSVTWGELAAAATLMAIPIIIMAAFANRQIVAGLTSGAVKG